MSFKKKASDIKKGIWFNLIIINMLEFLIFKFYSKSVESHLISDMTVH